MLLLHHVNFRSTATNRILLRQGDSSVGVMFVPQNHFITTYSKKRHQQPETVDAFFMTRRRISLPGLTLPAGLSPADPGRMWI